MIVKIDNCCNFMEVATKELIPNSKIDKNGEESGVWRLTLRISDILIRYCPFCGEKVEWIPMGKDWA